MGRGPEYAEVKEEEDEVDLDRDEEEGAAVTPTEAQRSLSDRLGPPLRSLASRGEMSMLACTLIYACQGIVAKTVERRVPATEVIACRSLVAGCITLHRAYSQRPKSKPPAAVKEEGGAKDPSTLQVPQESPSWEWLVGSKEVRHLCMLRGSLGSVAFLLFYAAYPHITIAVHSSLQFTFPIWILLFSWPALGERPQAMDMGAVVAGMLGTLLIVQPPFVAQLLQTEQVPGADSPSLLGCALALSGALFQSATMLVIRLSKGRVSAVILALYFHCFSCALGTLCLAVGLERAIIPSWPDLGLLGVISATSFAGQILLNRSYSILPSSFAASLNYLQIVWGFSLGYLVLSESVGFFSCLGAFLIGGTGFLAAFVKWKRSQELEAGSAPKQTTQPAYNALSSSGLDDNDGDEDEDDADNDFGEGEGERGFEMGVIKHSG